MARQWQNQIKPVTLIPPRDSNLSDTSETGLRFRYCIIHLGRPKAETVTVAFLLLWLSQNFQSSSIQELSSIVKPDLVQTSAALLIKKVCARNLLR